MFHVYGNNEGDMPDRISVNHGLGDALKAARNANKDFVFINMVHYGHRTTTVYRAMFAALILEAFLINGKWYQFEASEVERFVGVGEAAFFKIIPVVEDDI